jgi:hypothetical protein
MWAKLTKEQKEILGFSSYPGEEILIDYSVAKVDSNSFYFNAQEFFSEEELEKMPYFSVFLFMHT